MTRKIYVIFMIVLLVCNIIVAIATLIINAKLFRDTKFFLTGSTHPVVDIYARSIYSITIILLIHGFVLYQFVYKKRTKPLINILILITSIGLIFLSGQIIVKTQDKITESFSLLIIRQVEIKDRAIINYNLNGYDAKYHFKKEYSCYPFCDRFFTRDYQIGKDSVFKVFCGIGPTFRLE